MDRYERLERIDYKSARDVVTEADHLSEELIIDAIRASIRATRSSPRRAASIGRSRARRPRRDAAGCGSSIRSTAP